MTGAPTDTADILTIRDLSVTFNTEDGTVEAVRKVSCSVARGQCLGIVGESGSGKSQTFLAAMGLLARNGHAEGDILYGSQSLLTLEPRALNRIRGNRIAMIFQDPLTSLTPHLRIGDQMREVLKIHLGVTGKQATQRCIEWLARVRIPSPESRLKQYPHELSGGMRQRVMIAMAMLCEPEVLIGDEPTTALDVTIQSDILDVMNELRNEHGTAIVLITHDMGVVARMCDYIHVMRDGQYVESGTADQIFYQPTHNYTHTLLQSVPRLDSDRSSLSRQPTASDQLLDVSDITVAFRASRALWSKPSVVTAVDRISLHMHQGETLGIVGESGSGKSTLARAILQLVPVQSGSVTWLGQDLTKLGKQALKKKRRDLQIVFQDPLASLNPAMTIGASIMEPLLVHEPSLSKSARRQRVNDMLARVGLDQSMINRYPHELSGGQNQRVGIARAVILKPRLIICDEAVSALDVSIQAQILALLTELQADFDLSYLFISHDLSVVRQVSHRVLVMRAGRVVEMAACDDLFSNPRHPYTQKLMRAVPIPDPVVERTRDRTTPTTQADTEAAQSLVEVAPGHYVALSNAQIL